MAWLVSSGADACRKEEKPSSLVRPPEVPISGIGSYARMFESLRLGFPRNRVVDTRPYVIFEEAPRWSKRKSLSHERFHRVGNRSKFSRGYDFVVSTLGRAHKSKEL